MQVCRELRPRDLQALLLDAAVWLCCDDDTVYKLDTLCFGNLDGGAGTAAYVRRHLEAAGRPVQGDKAVRLSLDEAFFMAYALELLTVHDLRGGAAVPLDTSVRARRGLRPNANPHLHPTPPHTAWVLFRLLAQPSATACAERRVAVPPCWLVSPIPSHSVTPPNPPTHPAGTVATPAPAAP